MNSMTEEEKAYWALILMAKYVQEATDWNEQEFINNIYKDYRFEKILGSSFLSVTHISGIYPEVPSFYTKDDVGTGTSISS